MGSQTHTTVTIEQDDFSPIYSFASGILFYFVGGAICFRREFKMLQWMGGSRRKVTTVSGLVYVLLL